MEFLKKHFEKLLLAIALLGLMASAVLVAKAVGNLHTDEQIPQPRPTPPPPIDQAKLDWMLDQVDHPSVWKGGTPPMFISIERWWDKEKPSGKWVLATGEPRVQGETATGIPAQWLKENKLDYKDAEIGNKDADQDGWTNAEEYRFKTNPTNAESQPNPSDFLAFDRTIQNKFYLRFMGYLGGGGGTNDYTFQINVNDFDHTYFVRAGQQIKDAQRTENYWVDRFEHEEKSEFDPTLGANVTKDVSRLYIHRGDEKREIVLRFRETSLDTQLKVRIVSRVEPKQEFVRAKGEEFEFRGQTYKVVDIKNDGVLISDSLNREFKITAPKTGE